jgi:hypothetical protein
MNYTPGPWHDQCRSHTDGSLIVANDKGREVCCVRERPRTYGPQDDEDMANSRLIAAAPELLAACERIAEQLTEQGFVNQFEGGKLIAAIAKAKVGA